MSDPGFPAAGFTLWGGFLPTWPVAVSLAFTVAPRFPEYGRQPPGWTQNDSVVELLVGSTAPEQKRRGPGSDPHSGMAAGGEAGRLPAAHCPRHGARGGGIPVGQGVGPAPQLFTWESLVCR